MIDSDQLKESAEDLKKQRVSIEQQILKMQKDTVTENVNYPNHNEIDKFCSMVNKVIKNLRFEAKQSIVRKIVDMIVGTQLDIKVYGHLPINTGIIATIQKGGIQYVKFETESRHHRPSQCREVNVI